MGAASIQPHRFTQTYMRLVVVCGTAAILYAGFHLSFARLGLPFFMLAVTALGIGSRVNLKLPRLTSGVSLSDTFVFLTILMFDGEAAVLLGAAEAIIASQRVTRKKLTMAFNAAAMACSTMLTVWMLRWQFGSITTLANEALSARLLTATCVMALIQYAANSGIVAAATALRFSASIWETWKKYYLWTSIAYFAGAYAAAITLRLIDLIGFYAFAAMAPIVGIVYFTYSTYLRNIENSAAHAEQAEKHAAELQESEERFRSAFNHAPIGMALVAPDGRWLQVNRSLCEILGYTEGELLATNFQSITHPSHLGSLMSHIGQILEGKIATHQLEKRYFHKQGHEVWALVGISLAQKGETNATRLIFQIQDITDRKRAEEKLLHEAFHDSLTQLPNRAMFTDHLKLALERAGRTDDRLFAVLFIDLDRFKIINDSLGHLIGDKLLIEISQRLKKCLRPGDTVARLGGDEFTILLEELKGEGEAVIVAERIQQEVSKPCLLDGHEAFTTASIGIAFYNANYHEPAALLRDADTAMYQAKEAGKARHVIFDSGMHVHALKRMKLESDMRRALERQEFFLLYQPIISLPTNQLSGFEALIRWQHPEQGLISPMDFIPVAEENGSIVHIGQWVLQEALRQVRQWQEEFAAARNLKISVNLSGKQFTNELLLKQIIATLGQTNFDPRYLKLEITESVVMDNIETAINILKEMRAIGIQLSVDDFGTGYSSLSYLPRLPLTTLKVDRSFVNRMIENEENKEIVRTIIMLAHNLHLDVTAEGVETAEQAEQLRLLGCEDGQGYFFAKPLDVQSATQLILAQEPVALPVRQESSGEELSAAIASNYSM